MLRIFHILGRYFLLWIFLSNIYFSAILSKLSQHFIDRNIAQRLFRYRLLLIFLFCRSYYLVVYDWALTVTSFYIFIFHWKESPCMYDRWKQRYMNKGWHLVCGRSTVGWSLNLLHSKVIGKSFLLIKKKVIVMLCIIIYSVSPE